MAQHLQMLCVLNMKCLQTSMSLLIFFLINKEQKRKSHYLPREFKHRNKQKTPETNTRGSMHSVHTEISDVLAP